MYEASLREQKSPENHALRTHWRVFQSTAERIMGMCMHAMLDVFPTASPFSRCFTLSLRTFWTSNGHEAAFRLKSDSLGEASGLISSPQLATLRYLSVSHNAPSRLRDVGLVIMHLLIITSIKSRSNSFGAAGTFSYSLNHPFSIPQQASYFLRSVHIS